MRKSGARIRDLEALLARAVFEKVDETSGKSRTQKLYQALTISDQAQMREYYLSRVEEVEPGLRTKYRYY